MGILNNGCDEFCLLFFNAFGYGGFCKGRGGWTYGKDVGHQDKKKGKDCVVMGYYYSLINF
jgi:hypothetical protein